MDKYFIGLGLFYGTLRLGFGATNVVLLNDNRYDKYTSVTKKNYLFFTEVNYVWESKGN